MLGSPFTDNIALHVKAIVRGVVTYGPDKYTKRSSVAIELSEIAVSVGSGVAVVDCVA
jgi:hypothetical protein